MRCIRINSGQQRIAVQAIGEANTVRSLESFRQSHQPTASEIIQRHNQIQQIVSDQSVGATSSIGLVLHGVEDVFNLRPELSSVGTQEQYSKYLDSIYPTSTTGILFKGFRTKEGHKTPNHSWYTPIFHIADRWYKNEIGIKAYVADGRSLVEHELNTPLGVTLAKKEEEDFINDSYHDVVMLDTNDLGGNQIQYAIRKDVKMHELGTNEDIEAFRAFVANDNTSQVSTIQTEVNEAERLENSFYNDKVRNASMSNKLTILLDFYKAKYPNLSFIAETMIVLYIKTKRHG